MTAAGSGQPPPRSRVSMEPPRLAMVAPSMTTSNCPLDPALIATDSPVASLISAARLAARFL